ncbi:MAG: peptidoglycan-binding protein [Pseudomonas sp.]|nr:peptidoglycan-binding protein [Pseudomonas sp.]
MVNGYGMKNLKVAPSLTSRHIEGHAIDMSISWSGSLSILDSAGAMVTIATEPKTGMNTQLHAVGASYGVIKFRGGEKDKPHWSTDGR